MSYEIDRALELCFNGHSDRDCDSCPAHPSNGGSCCFADPQKYDPGDRECQYTCIHRKDCCELCGEFSPPRPVWRPSVSSGATVHASRTATTRPSSDNRIGVGHASPAERGRERFFKDVVWGAGEGLFKAGLDFFRSHKLR